MAKVVRSTVNKKVKRLSSVYICIKIRHIMEVFENSRSRVIDVCCCKNVDCAKKE